MRWEILQPNCIQMSKTVAVSNDFWHKLQDRNWAAARHKTSTMKPWANKH